jgi:hypothetical protein
MRFWDSLKCLSIPPQYSVSHTLGFLKGKSVVRIHREIMKARRMTGLHFWAKGYCVNTVGLDEERIRKCIREQEKLETGRGDLGRFREWSGATGGWSARAVPHWWTSYQWHPPRSF